MVWRIELNRCRQEAFSGWQNYANDTLIVHTYSYAFVKTRRTSQHEEWSLMHANFKKSFGFPIIKPDYDRKSDCITNVYSNLTGRAGGKSMILSNSGSEWSLQAWRQTKLLVYKIKLWWHSHFPPEHRLTIPVPLYVGTGTELLRK